MYCRNCGNEMSNEAAFCVRCGVSKGKGSAYCPNCGRAVDPEAVICVGCGVAIKRMTPKNIEKRDLVKAIVLTIVTCGIYGIFWFVKLTDEMNAMTGRQNETSGGISFLLTLVTCGIYGIYWAYKMGEKADELSENSSNKILYLVLQLFGLGIVVYALSQDTINKATDGK